MFNKTIIMLRVITYNCFNIKSSIQDSCDLCNSYDLVFLQETWLFEHELHLLSNICSDFEGFGTSAMDISNGIFSGRPHGGVAVLIRKSIRKACQLHSYKDSRLLGITVNIMDTFCYFLNVYMPYNNNNNNIYLNSNIHSIIRYKFSGLYNGIKHGIYIKTVQCI